MAHEIEYRADRRTDSFAFVGDRSAIWHRLGQQARPDWTVEQWMRAANQDYSVRKVPLAGIPGGEGDNIAVESHQLLIREDSGKALGIVSADWEPAQNVDAYSFLRPLIDVGFCSIDTAGTLYDGKRCFVLVKTKEGFQLPGGDDTEGYVLVQISHEYGLADLVLPVDLRVVCENTRRRALEGKTAAQLAAGRFVHRAKTAFSVEKAEALIEAYRKGLGEYAEQAKFLTTKRATPEQTRAYVNKVFKLEDLVNGTADEIAKRHEHNAKVVRDLTRAIETQPGANMSPGTWWSTYNAVTYWEDHGRHAGKDREPFASKFYGAAADRKDRAFKTALEMANA